MSFATSHGQMTPEKIKQREYLGLSSLTFGLLTLIAGAILLLYTIPISLVFIGLGAAFAAVGLITLSKIPDVVAQCNEF